jgi:molybdenum cofactor biosynthesis enzyme MoaA
VGFAVRIQTFSIVTGSGACNARCPFCVSRMTSQIPKHIINVNWHNFNIACKLAVQAGATTAMLTGKGEPTLWPELISEYLKKLEKYPIPLVELQTNGLAIANGIITESTLKYWFDLNLSTIAISIADVHSESNKIIYTPNQKYHELEPLIKSLHDIGFSIRLICVMVKGLVDNPDKVHEVISFSKTNKVEQLTFLPVSKPADASNEESDVVKWINNNSLSRKSLIDIHKYLDFYGSPVLELGHGAKVYDVNGQNVCLNNCLDPSPTNNDQMRNLIFFPDGRIRHRWDSDGSVIL